MPVRLHTLLIVTVVVLVNLGILSISGGAAITAEERDGSDGIRTAAIRPEADTTPKSDMKRDLPAVERRSLSEKDRQNIRTLAGRFNIEPEHLKAIISFETAGTFNPAIRNPRSGAVGLIQFTRRSADQLGVTPDELAAMSFSDKLNYVEQYLASTRLVQLDRPGLSDVYMAVFAPSLIGAPDTTPVYRKEVDGQKYAQNAEIDLDNDGFITKHEAMLAVTRHWYGTIPGEIGEGFFDVFINGVAQNYFVYVETSENDRIFVAVEDYARFGFAVDIEPEDIDGRTLIELTGRDGLHVRFAVEGDALHIEAAPEWFEGTFVNLRRPRAAAPSEAVPGGYINYTVQANADGDGLTSLSASPSLALFGKWGILDMTAAIHVPLRHGRNADFRRILTTYTKDFPDRRASLVVGDGVTRQGPGAPALRYGGVSYRSDFDLDPMFSVYQFPSFTTGARLPSTIEFMIDDRRIGAPIDVPAGPVQIDGLPTVDGEGQVRVVVRDILGNEQEVLVPFLHARNLYRPGVHKFSYTGGFLRRKVDTYDTPFVSTVHRYGVSERLTADFAAMASTRGGIVGAGALTPLGGLVLADMSAAFSLTHGVPGYKLSAEISPLRRTFSINWGLGLTHTSRRFGEVFAHHRHDHRPRNEARAFAGVALGDLGTISASAGYIDRWDGSSDVVGTARWSRSFGRGIYASLDGVFRSDEMVLRASLSFPLGGRQRMRTSTRYDRDTLVSTAEYQRQVPTDYGVGYSLRAGHRNELRTDRGPGKKGDSVELSGRVLARTGYGDHRADFHYDRDRLSGRLATSGSVGMAGGAWFIDRPISSGLAVVRTGDATGIPIYRENQPVAQTGSRGVAIISGLRPYERNSLMVKPEDVPFEYSISETSREVVPATRGAVAVDFPMLRTQSAVIVLVTPEGDALPAGTRVTVTETDEKAYVALRGEAFISHMPSRATINVQANGKSCTVSAVYPDTDDPQPLLGPFVCDLS